jgi:hypothetical protein
MIAYTDADGVFFHPLSKKIDPYDPVEHVRLSPKRETAPFLCFSAIPEARPVPAFAGIAAL